MTREFPKTHLLAAGGLGLAVSVMLLLSPSSDVEANRISIPLQIKEASLNEAKEPSTAGQNFPEDSMQASSSPQLPESDEDTLAQWDSFEVKKGDTLSTLFKKAGFNDGFMYQVIAGHKRNKQLANIYPGETLAFLRNSNDELTQIRLQRNQLDSLVVSRGEDGKFTSEEVSIEPEVQLAYAEGEIDSSLFLAGQKAGLKQSMIMELANIFGWDIDFILDIRDGDKFNLVYEELYIDGNKIGEGKIIAATFNNQGRELKAVLYKDKKGDENYFTPEGHSMRKAFLRTPIDFARISSHFNLRRKHPVLHTIRAHKGTDYAAGRGTPIKATGDGKVIHAGRKGGYGKAVVIQHGQKISTLYAHMSKYARGVRTGSRVKQGQIIGYVGSTGLASGPHLHYEFKVNGVQKNSVKVKLPQANPISKNEMAEFKKQTNLYLSQLDTLSQSYRLASN
ncbi:OapA family protein [Alkalimarinus alittae]|uniref:Peptidoglycan DD-metalloendopeptidase family protein n=1 Tax=Alkalimarinus alittae TaxID=2961619 RepID=A0ABY6N1H9_9ALTE|nr:peptidoglycan DD-metalloendopeptidase family protein [Alkalimarinus alittae]UZE95854.1 peptidoglycan DD-metalloendopeptidase family protein [Alkalimarinus alittae]